jgi:hypothetical protein
MRSKILPKIVLVSGLALIFLILAYQSQIKDTWSVFIEKATIYFDNYFFSKGREPERKRPIGLLERETELALYIGEPFKEFSRDDWREFWNIIYGGFAKVDSGKGLPNRMRQLTPDEIKYELSSRYPQPFSYFREQHWRIFFDIIEKK